jgi:hypothetical protein
MSATENSTSREFKNHLDEDKECRLSKRLCYILRYGALKEGTRCSLKRNKNMNKRATKRKSATENSILKFLAVSSVSSDSIKTAVKTAEVDEQKTKYYLQHLQQSCQIKQRYTLHLHPAFIE